MFFAKSDISDKAVLDALNRSQAVIRFKPDGTIVEANSNFLAVVGYNLEEIKGKHHRLFVNPAEAQGREYAQFWERLAKGEFVAAQFQRFGKGGKEVWIEASYNPILDRNGVVSGIVKYATDITKQKLQNADYEGQLQAIRKSQAVIEFHLDGTIITANQNFLDAMGYTLPEIQGKHHRMFADSAYANSEDYAQFWQRLNRGEFFTGEFQRFGKGGKEVWIQASYNPIFDMDGKSFKIVKFASDITSEKLANATAHGQLEAISKAQAVIEFHLDGTIITANQNFLDAVGYTLAEIQGNHHRMFVDPVDAQSQEYAQFWEKLGKGEFDSRVYKRVGKGGKEIWIQASYNPIFDASGRPLKVVKYATDVTPVIQTGRIAGEAVMNVNSVAAAVEQMAASINEISNHMSKSKDAADAILQDTTQSTVAADQLRNGMNAMQNVVDVINSIAAQVKLLALNATIEAARAGDAGKGFAVVASEVKELATQTTDATENIARQIQEVQHASHSVLESIKHITESATHVSQYVNSVAASVEQQTAVTKEISANTQHMAASVGDISERIDGLIAS